LLLVRTFSPYVITLKICSISGDKENFKIVQAKKKSKQKNPKVMQIKINLTFGV
jgi:uncharacterized metal-binding protein